MVLFKRKGKKNKRSQNVGFDHVGTAERDLGENYFSILWRSFMKGQKDDDLPYKFAILTVTDSSNENVGSVTTAWGEAMIFFPRDLFGREKMLKMISRILPFFLPFRPRTTEPGLINGAFLTSLL